MRCTTRIPCLTPPPKKKRHKTPGTIALPRCILRRQHVPRHQCTVLDLCDGFPNSKERNQTKKPPNFNGGPEHGEKWPATKDAACPGCPTCKSTESTVRLIDPCWIHCCTFRGSWDLGRLASLSLSAWSLEVCARTLHIGLLRPDSSRKGTRTKYAWCGDTPPAPKETQIGKKGGRSHPQGK